jgi:hypothetical protein
MWHPKVSAGDEYHGPDLTYRIVSAIPIVLTNLVSIFGAFSWLHSNLQSWGLTGQIIFAATFDSVAVFLAFSAHHSQMRDDASFGLKLSSRFFGLILGAMSGSHFLKDGHVTLPAIAVFVASASSPWLWSVYSAQTSRNTLMLKGLIEHHALRPGTARWLWHPIRTTRLMSDATWTGERMTGRALQTFEEKKAAKITARETAREARELEKAVKELPAQLHQKEINAAKKEGN